MWRAETGGCASLRDDQAILSSPRRLTHHLSAGRAANIFFFSFFNYYSSKKKNLTERQMTGWLIFTAEGRGHAKWDFMALCEHIYRVPHFGASCCCRGFFFFCCCCGNGSIFWGLHRCKLDQKWRSRSHQRDSFQAEKLKNVSIRRMVTV